MLSRLLRAGEMWTVAWEICGSGPTTAAGLWHVSFGLEVCRRQAIATCVAGEFGILPASQRHLGQAKLRSPRPGNARNSGGAGSDHFAGRRHSLRLAPSYSL